MVSTTPRHRRLGRGRAKTRKAARATISKTPKTLISLFQAIKPKAFEPAIDAFRTRFNIYIDKRRAFHPTFYRRNDNLRQAVRVHLNKWRDGQLDFVLVQTDKKMGDLFVLKADADKAALDILSDTNTFRKLHFSESFVAARVMQATADLAYRHLSVLRDEWKKHPKFKTWQIMNGIARREKKYERPPNIRPLRKLYKPGSTWRRVINASAWYSCFVSAFLGEELRRMATVLQFKLNFPLLLENTFEMVSLYHKTNTFGGSFKNCCRVMVDFDVKALYDNIELEQSLEVITYLNSRYLQWRTNRFRFVAEAIQYFAQHSAVRYEDHLYQVIKGIGTGYAHSMNVTNLTLLGYEICNHNLIISRLNPLNSFVSIC